MKTNSYDKNGNFNAEQHDKMLLERIEKECKVIATAVINICEAKYQSINDSDSNKCASKILQQADGAYMIVRQFMQRYDQKRIDLFINED